jgi:hypothetical protein
VPEEHPDTTLLLQRKDPQTANSHPAPATAPQIDQYSLQATTLGSASDFLLADWRAFAAQHAQESPIQDPEWLRGYFADELENISTYLLYKSGRICGSASFLLKPWPVQWHLGELKVAELPLRRLRLLGSSLLFPENEAVYDLLFKELANRINDFDALYLTQIPVESYLWKYLTTSQLLRKTFQPYVSEEASLHPRLRLGKSFDEYMKKFSKTHRHTLRRKVTRFEEEAPGKVRFERYTRPDQVIPFLDDAVQVSRKTYQWNLHQRGLRATELIKRRLLFAAEHGWFRSYLLYCGDTPYAFLAGYQWRGRYYTDEIGFDPVLAKRSPGTVLQMLMIQDLFSYDPPEFIDFGSYDKYKEEFSNDNYQHCAMFLFRRGTYPWLVRSGDYSSRLITKTLSRTLAALKLKSKLKKIIRNQSVKGE